MLFRVLVAFGAILAIGSTIAYFVYFGAILDYSISESPEDWAFLGAYIGGVITPALTFISVIFLIRSLDLQKQANKRLEDEVARSEKFNQLKSFEEKFFHLIEAQRNLFNYLELKFSPVVVKKSTEAVIFLEDLIYELRCKKVGDLKISELISQVDYKDSMYSISRGFYVIQKTIHQKLTSELGFSRADRKDHYTTLVNFSDYALLRLLMISLRFETNEVNKKILDNECLLEVFEEVGLLDYKNDL